MKTYNRLFNQIYSFENLLLAARKAQDGKRFQEAVARFNFHLERELYRLQEELQTRTYRPGPYHEFHIYEPKLRKISAAPYRDRVVHHALCNVIEPIFDRTFIFDSYACRRDKGTHKAVDRFTEFCRKSDYVLKCDIKKYFPSIDHGILKTLFRRKIRDANVLWLMDLIVDFSNPQEGFLDERGIAGDRPPRYGDGDTLGIAGDRPPRYGGTETLGIAGDRPPRYGNGDIGNGDIFGGDRRRGIPIGNLTSQFYANIYLNGFDHFVKETLKCRHYIRYVDDFVVLDNDKARLHQVKAEMEAYLAQHLRLQLHEHKCQISPVKTGTDFLGYRVFPTHRLLRQTSVTRARRRLRRLQQDYAAGDISQDAVKHSVQSWLGHVKHADTYGLRRAIFSQLSFRRSS